MTWMIDDKEFEAVLGLPSEQRYSYFIKRVADWQETWSLWGEGGWILADEDDGHKLVPIWPHPRFAQACVAGPWKGSEPRAINLDTWLEHWTPGMIRDGRVVAVFPTPSMKGIVVSPERLKDDLKAELTLYE